MATEVGSALPGIAKVPTGVTGLDEILTGGIPRNRTTLVCGGAGCGKTLLAMAFLCNSARDAGEHGVFIAFEETPDELAANAASLGYDLVAMQAAGTLVVDHVALDSADIVTTGEYDLEGLFLRIGAAVDAVGATLIALDTIEVLFGALRDATVVRAELKRLFSWLKARGLTALVTAERGDNDHITRFGIEEYVSDCVILLDHRVEEERSTRRLRVTKYRGSVHGADEYPFLISGAGIEVLPITSLHLDQSASTERVSTGIDRLDFALSGGVYRDSSVLVSGAAGGGKSTFAAHFVDGACRRGERALYVSYEESASQICRNMASVGLDLVPWVDAGLLRIESVRPNLYGLEAHLAALHGLLDAFEPSLVVIDPITSLVRVGTSSQVAGMLMRLVDELKSRGITAVYTSLTQPDALSATNLEISSLVDTWLLVLVTESDGEHNRLLDIVKSRGMAHSNQLTEVAISERGIELLEPYVGPEGVLTGSARRVQEASERVQDSDRAEQLADREHALSQRRAVVEAQVAALRAGLETEAAQLARIRRIASEHEVAATTERLLRSRDRWGMAPDDEPIGEDEAR